jgi:hypothetical protein
MEAKHQEKVRGQPLIGSVSSKSYSSSVCRSTRWRASWPNRRLRRGSCSRQASGASWYAFSSEAQLIIPYGPTLHACQTNAQELTAEVEESKSESAKLAEEVRAAKATLSGTSTAPRLCPCRSLGLTRVRCAEREGQLMSVQKDKEVELQGLHDTLILMRSEAQVSPPFLLEHVFNCFVSTQRIDTRRPRERRAPG